MRSTDLGEGNPPSMIRLQDGRLCLTYGVRKAPWEMRAQFSSDAGHTWSEPFVLQTGGGGRDLGYPRTLQRPDGKIVTTYYFQTPGQRLPPDHCDASGIRGRRNERNRLDDNTNFKRSIHAIRSCKLFPRRSKKLAMSVNQSQGVKRLHLHIEERGFIYDAATQPAGGRIAFFTSLCRLRSGGWISGFQVGTGKHSPDSTIQLCRSTDGQHWTPLERTLSTQIDGVPGSLSAPALVDAEDGRLLLFATWFDRSDPARPLFDPETQGILHSRLLVAESSDAGDTWSAWRILPTPGLTGCSGTGEVVSWPDGTLAMAFESFRQFDDPQPRHHAAWMMVSRNAGRSFSPPMKVAQHPQDRLYYWDQRLCPTNRCGEFVALFWTHDLAAQRDLRVHLLRATVEGDDDCGKRHSRNDYSRSDRRSADAGGRPAAGVRRRSSRPLHDDAVAVA